MLKKYLSLTLVVLVANLTWAAPAFASSEAIKEAQPASKAKANVPFAGTLRVSCVLAGSPSNPQAESRSAAAQPEAEAKSKSKPKQNLRSRVLTLVAETKAGKVMPAERSQIQPAKSNNLSTKVKVAIGVGVAIVVLALIVKHARDHLFDNFVLR